MTVLMEGVSFGESPRWHEGRLWFSDWGAHQVVVLDPATGGHEVVATVDSFPMCIDFLPDGRLLVVDSARSLLLRREPDGSLVTHADLGGVSRQPWNDLVVDAEGNAYVNNIGFAFPDDPPAPGLVALVTARGEVREVAADLAFPNGMVITDDQRTLVVAESYAERLTAFPIRDDGSLGERRTWADTPGDHPDGICADAEGALWYADVGGRRCVRVQEGGEVLATVELDRGAFSCTLSRDDRPVLYVVAQAWDDSAGDGPTGQVLAFPAPAAGAGRP